MNKRVMLVIDNLGSGGAQRQIVNLAIGLRQDGYKVSVFIYHDILHFLPDLHAAGIDLYCFPKRFRYSVSPIFDLRKIILSMHIEVVISFLETPSLYAELATFGLKGTKLIVSERFMYPEGSLPWRLRVLQEFHRLANVITVNSTHQRLRMERSFPWMKPKIFTIYNGYDLDKYSRPAVGPVSSIHYLAIASVAGKKNSLNLARALCILRDKYSVSVHVSWVGVTTVAEEGDSTFRATDTYIEENNLRASWEWLGQRADVPALLKTCKALIHPSFYEGLPNVICEALASGKPVLASGVCDHPILVKEAERGYLFDPASPESIAEAIRIFESLSDREITRLGENGRLYAEQELSLDRYKRQYSCMLDNL